MTEEDLVYRLRKRAEIRRQIQTRKSVQEGKPDRIADLLEEAAAEINYLRNIGLDAIAWRWSENGGKSWYDWTTEWTHHMRAIELGCLIEYAYSETK